MIDEKWALGDVVRVGGGKTVWKIISFWWARGGDAMATLQRVDRADVHTSCEIERLVPAAIADL